MLREAVSSVGLTFFPVAALMIFLIVYFSVLGRSFRKNSKRHWNAMASMALEDSTEAPSSEEQTR